MIMTELGMYNLPQLMCCKLTDWSINDEAGEGVNISRARPWTKG